jgi:hypothetical protein
MPRIFVSLWYFYLMKMAGPIVKAIAVLCVSALLSACSVFQESDSDRAFGLIQSACRIEKDSGSGDYMSGVATYSYETWDPRQISESELNEKVDWIRQNSQNAIQANFLDSKWSNISEALEKLMEFVTRVKQAQVNGQQAYVTWTNDDFNVPNGVYKRNCEAVASLMNE